MEQEIYVKEMPKSCYICPCFDTSEAMCSMTGTYTKFKQGRILEECPLKSLHDNNKELVEKVLDKVRKEFSVGCCEIIFQDCHWLGKQAVLDKLDKIQNEVEDEQD